MVQCSPRSRRAALREQRRGRRGERSAKGKDRRGRLRERREGVVVQG